MEINTTTHRVIKWDHSNSGKFETHLEDDKITQLEFCLVGSDKTKCLHSIDELYLRDIYKSLGDLFAKLDEIRALGVQTETADHE